jgi:hypothetical protein
VVKDEDSRHFKVLFHPHFILILVSKKKKMEMEKKETERVPIGIRPG